MSSEPPGVLSLPARPQEDTPAVYRHGLGYRGIWPREGFLLDFTQIQVARGGSVEGLLSVRCGQPTPFVCQFNAAALGTRTTVAKRLERVSEGYEGWPNVLDFFCRHLLLLVSEGSGFERLTDPGTALAPSYRLAPIIPKNVATILYGPSGSMKSTLAAAISVSVAAPVPLLGWLSEAAPVLVIDYETDREEWGGRVGAAARGLGVDYPSEIQYHRAANPLHQAIERIAGQVSSMAAGLVVVDSLGMALGIGREGGDPNDAIVRLFGALRLVDTTWLLLDHVSAEGAAQSSTSAKPYGSIYKVNLARSSYELRREHHAGTDGTRLRLHHYNVNRGPRQPDRGVLVRHHEAMIEFTDCDLPPDLAGTLPLHQRMRELLGTTGALSARAIADDLGLSGTDTIRQAIRRHEGLFLRLSDGRIGLQQGRDMNRYMA